MDAWSVYIELAATDTPDAVIDTLHDVLSTYDAVVGHASNGHLNVQLSIDTPTARQAIAAALKVVTAAVSAQGENADVVGLELLAEAELERRLDDPQIPDLVGISEIAGMTGVVRQRATQLAKQESFPPAVANLRSGPVFVREQVSAWVAKWDRTAGRPVKRVELTALERDLVTALALTQARQEREPKLDQATQLLRRHATVDWRDGQLLLRAPGEELDRAIASLRVARLIHARETRTGTSREISLGLTKRGEKTASP